VREETMSVVDRINDETEFKPKRSALCDWCEYNDRCPIYPRDRSGNDRAPARSSDPVPVAGIEGQLHLFGKKPQAEPS